ncbi:TPA: tape measure protein [Salmonella enterica subsp. enterica serovar Waycross]
MAEEVGGIVYEVGMDVKGLKAGQQSADKALGGLESSLNKTTGEFNKLDKGARNAGSGMRNAGGSANSLKTSITALAGAISISLVMEWGKTFLTVADNMTQLQARIARLSTDAAAAKQTFSDLTAIASRTGASLSDTTKLWESLTSSLKEAGATNAQVLNLTDTLQKIGRIGGSSTEEMANALRQFGQSIASGTIRAEEFNSILEQMPELARQIATGLGMSMGQLRQAMLDGKLTAQDALNAIQDRTGAVNAEFSKLPRSLSQATGSLETSFAKLVVAINDATGASSTAVQVVDKLAGYVDMLGDKSTSTADKLWSLAEVISKLNPGVVGSTLADFIMGDDDEKKLAAYNAQIERFTKASKDGYEAAKKQAEGVKHVTIATAESTKKKGGKAGGKSTEEKQSESVAEKLEQLRQKAMLAANSTQELSRAQAILNAEQSLGKGATQDQIKLAGEYAAQAYDVAAALKAQQAAEKQRQETEKNYQQIRSTASPSSGLDTQFQAQMASLDSYAQLYPQKIAEVEQTRANIEAQYREQRMAAMWDEWSQQNAATMAAAAAFDSLGSTASNALTGILTGSMSVSDAMRNIGMTVLNSVINTFVQMGIEWVKSAIMGQAAQTAAIGTVTAVQTAAVGTQTAVSTAAAATTAAAWTPAAILSSIASMGTAAAIGLGAVAGVIGTSLLGKRKNGGPVAAGGMYQVGEGNAPEIFQASTGRQYMIAGDGGKVISNKDIMAGGGSGLVIYNNVSNYTSSNVTTTATDNGDGTITIDTIVADIEENGPIGQALSRNYTANRRATE